ncbi:hypothetical protein B1J92_G05720g [Nakaseomyces glabratus]|nr:hypothetical protein B1J91_G05720g [Nakaseomyces glabratus]OXB48677.1 hypothetical protein B1J92_G05720g [Nakaseomyces glabratus]
MLESLIPRLFPRTDNRIRSTQELTAVFESNPSLSATEIAEEINRYNDSYDFSIRELVLSRSTAGTMLSKSNMLDTAVGSSNGTWLKLHDNEAESSKPPSYDFSWLKSYTYSESSHILTPVNVGSQQSVMSFEEVLPNLVFQNPSLTIGSEGTIPIESLKRANKSDNPFKIPENATLIETEQLWSPVIENIPSRFKIDSETYKRKRMEQLLFFERSSKLGKLFRRTSSNSNGNYCDDCSSNVSSQSTTFSTTNNSTYNGDVNIPNNTAPIRHNIQRKLPMDGIYLNTSNTKKSIWKQYQLLQLEGKKVVYMDGENVEERSNILGFGASGEVKLATKMGDNKLYAIKVFHDIAMDEISRLENSSEMSVDIETNDAPSSVEHSLGTHEGIDIFKLSARMRSLKRIHTEYAIGSALNHENIIKTYDLFYENGSLYTVMEYCDYDLYALVVSNKLTYDEVCCYFKQVLHGISYLHDIGISHRDLKLDNCVVNKEGVLKLIDFGSSTVFNTPYLEHRVVMRSSGIHGSNPYLAPEVCYYWSYDPRPTDIWAAAIMFICMITKRFPWREPRCSDLQFTRYIKYKEPQEQIMSRHVNSKVLLRLLQKTPYEHLNNSSRGVSKRHKHRKNLHDYEHYCRFLEKNRYLMDPLVLVPEEAQQVLSHMLELAPACRFNIHEVLSDQWVDGIEACTIRNEAPLSGCKSDNKSKMSATQDVYADTIITHKHSSLPQTSAHMGQLQNEQENKR